MFTQVLTSSEEHDKIDEAAHLMRNDLFRDLLEFETMKTEKVHTMAELIEQKWREDMGWKLQVRT